ncbi:hypothetical protein ACC764_39165, partial [Rhizobium ruizarguesonis]
GKAGALEPEADDRRFPHQFPDEIRTVVLDGTKALLNTYPNLLLEGGFPGGFNPTVKTKRPEGWVDDRTVGIDKGLVVMT